MERVLRLEAAANGQKQKSVDRVWSLAEFHLRAASIMPFAYGLASGNRNGCLARPREAVPLLRCYVTHRGDSHELLGFDVCPRLNMTCETESTDSARHRSHYVDIVAGFV